MKNFQRIVLIGTAVTPIMSPSCCAHQEICGVSRVVAHPLVGPKGYRGKIGL